MKDYASMSDFEINKSVALALGFRLYKDGKSCWENHVAIEEGRCGAFAMDWCNNPADAWPVIISSMISIRPVGHDGKLWEAAGMDGMKADYDKNPLRAAMVVFLMMKEDE